MIWWTGLAPWEFGFPFPGSLVSTFLVGHTMYVLRHWWWTGHCLLSWGGQVTENELLELRTELGNVRTSLTSTFLEQSSKL